MLKALCLALGIACWDGDRPPQVAMVPATAMAAAESPAVATPAVAVPRVKPAPLFDATCDVQPPDSLKPHYWRAARRYPTGATQCELARQGEAESSFRVDAVSPAGAVGVAQFLPGTAADLGIDPWDPAQAIEGQARYMLWCQSQWNPDYGRTRGDIRGLSLVCYNWGLGNALESQKRWSWVLYRQAKPRLPAETRRYVAKIEGL